MDFTLYYNSLAEPPILGGRARLSAALCIMQEIFSSNLRLRIQCWYFSGT